MFRNCLKSDLNLSDRLEATGLKSVLLDTLNYSFSGEPFKPPESARALLETLFCTEHSLCRINIRGNKILHISNWPSWLNKGHRKHIMILLELFYCKVGEQHKCARCNLCKQLVQTTLWHHVFHECHKLHEIDASDQWLAFVKLLRMDL
jgi:hypothetical protein